MEFPFSSAVLNVHAHATEDEQRVLDALRVLLPEDIEIQRSKLEGHHGNQIIVFEARINRKALLRELWGRIVARLRADDLENIRRVLPTKFDEACHFYLRFDKQLAYRGELALTEGGDAVRLKLKTVAFPAKREVAIGLVKKFLGMGLNDEEKAQIHRV
jgi:RNA binding exosome subunit